MKIITILLLFAIGYLPCFCRRWDKLSSQPTLESGTNKNQLTKLSTETGNHADKTNSVSITSLPLPDEMFLTSAPVYNSTSAQSRPWKPCSKRNTDNDISIKTRVRRQTSSRCRTTGIIFRTADGFCNNIFRPTWGQAKRPFKRYMKPVYRDGIGAPRIESVKSTCFGHGRRRICKRELLPSGRTISTALHTPSLTTSVYTLMFMQWGQFLNHDISGTESVLVQPRSLCCLDRRSLRGELHPDSFRNNRDCFPIPIPRFPRDRFFDQPCLEFHRSRPVTLRMSKSHPREQINKLTSFIDGSAVYGSSQAEQNRLRDRNGRMKMSPGGLLPRDDKQSKCVLDRAPFCFLAGDDRVHVYPGLTATHTLFVRFHNLIVAQLERHTNWGGERLFQETRKIIGAIMQKITYENFLPELLSPATLNKFDLRSGNYTYNRNTDPRLANDFSGGAFRYGHSQMTDFMNIGGRSVKVRHLFNNPKSIFDNFEDVARNLVANPMELNDRFMSTEITDHLFERNRKGGTDLAAINIQRGRDHGLPSYNTYRKFCGLVPLTFFDTKVFGNAASILKNVYSDVNDIDLYTGGLLEKKMKGSLISSVFNCILGRQFRDLKYGDSFWYETKDKRRGFTTSQLASIKKVTFARILCQAFRFLKVQKDPFRVKTNRNVMVDCSSLPGLDLRPWFQK